MIKTDRIGSFNLFIVISSIHQDHIDIRKTRPVLIETDHKELVDFINKTNIFEVIITKFGYFWWVIININNFNS